MSDLVVVSALSVWMNLSEVGLGLQVGPRRGIWSHPVSAAAQNAPHINTARTKHSKLNIEAPTSYFLILEQKLAIVVSALTFKNLGVSTLLI